MRLLLRETEAGSFGLIQLAASARHCALAQIRMEAAHLRFQARAQQRFVRRPALAAKRFIVAVEIFIAARMAQKIARRALGFEVCDAGSRHNFFGLEQKLMTEKWRAEK